MRRLLTVLAALTFAACGSDTTGSGGGVTVDFHDYETGG